MSHDVKSDAENGVASLNGPRVDRPTQPNTCTLHAHEAAQQDREVATCTQSPRPERVQRTLSIARDEAAAIWSRVRREHVLNEDPLASNERIAWACGVDEKDVRRWGKNEKPLCAAVALVTGISPTLVEDFFDELLRERRQLSVDTYSIVALGRAVQRCDTYTRNSPFTKERRQAYVESLRRFADQLRALADETEVG